MNKKKNIDPEELKVLTLEGSKVVGKIFRLITDEVRSPEYNKKEQKGEINWNLTPTDENIGQTSSLSFFDPKKVKKNGGYRNRNVKFDEKCDIVNITTDPIKKKIIITDNVNKTTKKVNMNDVDKAIDIVTNVIGLVNEIKKL